MLPTHLKHTPTLPVLACAVLLLAACDSSNSVGGAAGDADDLPAAIALLAPFTGIYDLQDDWNGVDGDEAFLVIEAPGSDGQAPAALYDFDDASNCVPQSPFNGVLSKDLLPDSTRVFMDGILLFDQAELFLSDNNNTLTIEFNDYADLNNNGSTQDSVSVTATRLSISLVSDLGTTCA